MNAISKDFKVTNRERAIGQKILQSFKNADGFFRQYLSGSKNDIGLDDELYLNYVTFTSAIDYQKNIEANTIWKAGKEWVRKYPSLFKPEQLMNKTLTQIMVDFKSIREDYPGVFRPQDIGIWLLITDALYAYKGSTLNLLKSYNFDAWKIYEDLSGPLKKNYPFLSGPKILPMWLKILSEDAGIQLRNMDRLPLPVDKNVAEATYNLLLNRKFDGDVDARITKEVRAVWKQIADDLKSPVISFDTPLWILGGNTGCSSLNHVGCTECPVNSYCYLHK